MPLCDQYWLVWTPSMVCSVIITNLVQMFCPYDIWDFKFVIKSLIVSSHAFGYLWHIISVKVHAWRWNMFYHSLLLPGGKKFVCFNVHMYVFMSLCVKIYSIPTVKGSKRIILYFHEFDSWTKIIAFLPI